MKTFETRKIIKEHGMFEDKAKKERTKGTKSMKIEEPRNEAPFFSESKTIVKAKNNIFEAKLSKSITRKKGITFSDGIHKVEMIPLIDNDSKAILLEDGRALFQFFNGVDDLRYSLKETGIKEEIIVHEKRDSYTYKFELKLSKLIPQLVDSEMMIFIDEVTGDEVFKIADLLMIDSNGAKSNSITLDFDKGILTMTCNNLWINDEERVLPIIIDPQIEVITRPILSLIGVDRNNFRVPFSNGKLIVGKASADITMAADLTVNCQRVFQLANSQPGKFTLSFSYDKGIITTNNPKRFKVIVNNEQFENGLKFDQPGRYSIDITKFVMSEQQELKIRVSISTDPITADIENFIMFGFSENESLNPSIRCETVDIGEAIETATLDKKLSQDDDMSIDLHDGNYTYKYDGPSIKSKALKVGLNFVHSSIKRTNEEIKDAHIGGLKTNLHQYLVKSSTMSGDIETKKVLYIDGDNRSHELFERWYYETSTGLKKFVNKEDVFLDNDGELKVTESGTTFDVKYEVISDDGLSLVSASALSGYTKKSSRKITGRVFSVQLNGGTRIVSQVGTGTIRMPHFTTSPMTGSLLPFSQIPDWQKDPLDAYQATLAASERWYRWDYAIPSTVPVNDIGGSMTTATYATHFYDLPLLKDQGGYYVEVYSKKEIVERTDEAGRIHSILYKGETPTKVYLIEEIIYEFDQESDIYKSDDLIAAIDKVKQINKYINELYLGRLELEKTIKELDEQIVAINKEGARSEVNSELNCRQMTNVVKLTVDYGNATQEVTRKDSIASLDSRRVSLLSQLGDYYKKIDEYEIMLSNALDEENRLIELQKDNVNDLIIDKNGNALGFDYHGKLIMIQDQFENKIEINYEKEKIISISGEKEKISFFYNKKTNLLEFITDPKGRKLFFEYTSNGSIKCIRKEQKTGSHKVVGLSFNTSSNLIKIDNYRGYLTDIIYDSQTSKITSIKQKSFIRSISTDSSLFDSTSSADLPVVFENNIQYLNDKTIVTETRNNMSVAYKFDEIGRVINEETFDTISINNFVEDMHVLEARFDKHSENALTISSSPDSFTKIINLSLGTLPTNGTRVDKTASITGMYVFLADIQGQASANLQVTLGAQVLQGTTEVEKTKLSVRYDNPISKTIALPVFIPNDGTSTQLQISISSKNDLSLIGLSNFRLAKGEWTLNQFDEQERITKQTSGGEIAEFFDFVKEKPTRVVKTNLQNEKSTSIFEYDEEGRVVFAKDGLGNVEETYFNDKNQVIEKRKFNESMSSEVDSIKYKYDESGELIKDEKAQFVGSTELISQVEDEKGGITNFGYDFVTEELTSKTFIGREISNRTRYIYTDNLLTTISHNGIYVNYTLDYLGRKLETQMSGDSDPVTWNVFNDNFVYDSNNPTFIGKSVIQFYKDDSGNKFIYDKNGRLIKTIFHQDMYDDPTTTTEFAYDVYGRKTSKKVNGVTDETYIYHQNGNLTSRTFNSVTESYVFDAKQRIVAINNTAFSHPVSIEYDSKNNVKKVSASTISLSTSYDALQRVDKMSLTNGTNELLTDTFEFATLKNGPTNLVKEHVKYLKGLKDTTTTYSYDKNGNIIRINTDEFGIRYEYDELNRLIREDNETLNKTYLYRYDVGGNITSKREFAFTLDDEPKNPQSRSVFQYNLIGQKDQLSKIIVDGAVTNVTYDIMGRPLSYRGKTLSWNKQGTLNSFDGTSFTYNSDGIRTAKGTTTFTLDGTRILEQKTGTNSLKPIYFIDKMIGLWYNGTRYLFSKNIQGDITSIHSDSGDIVARYTYDAYGNHQVLTSGGLIDTNQSSIGNINPFRYRGYYYDVETGLYYLNSRYYDSRVGRFISIDILSILDQTMMDSNGLNLYMYCGDNPVMRADPNGNEWWDWGSFWKIFGGIALITLLVAGTIFTCGTLSLVLAGAAIGAISGAIGATVSTAVTGDWNSFANNFLIGTITGAISGAIGASSVGTLAQIATNSLIGIASYTINSLANGDNITFGSLILSAGFGALTSLIGTTVKLGGTDKLVNAFVAFGGKNFFATVSANASKTLLFDIGKEVFNSIIIGGLFSSLYSLVSNKYNPNGEFWNW